MQRVYAGSPASSSAPVLTLTAGAPIGDTLILALKTSASFAVSSVADSKGNTWTVDKTTTASSSARLSICSTRLTTAMVTGDTITATLSGTSTATAGAVYQYNGLALTSAVDAAVGFQGNTSTSGATGACVTTHANDLIFTAAATGAGTGWTAPGSPWTERSAGLNAVDAADQTVTATGSFNPTWTWTTSSNFGVATVGYKYASVVGAGPKAYVSGAWTAKPVKVWDGSAWVVKTLKRYDTGTSTWKTV